jgi:hypothetical protein
MNSNSSVSAGGDAPASAPKTARVVTNQQHAIVPASGATGDAHDDDGEHEEAPPVVNKLTECVEFDRDAEVRALLSYRNSTLCCFVE